MVDSGDALQSEWGEELEVEVFGQSIDELVSAAAAARCRGARITFRGLQVRRISDLLRIASAGGRWKGLHWAGRSTPCSSDDQGLISAAS